MRNIRSLVVLSLALLAIGCSNTKTFKYDISVQNQTDRPITVWLTKDGAPVEKGWRSPEQLAMTLPAHEERISGLVIPPGKTAESGVVSGKFAPGVSAWLRVYDGKHKFSELLAMSPGDPDRLDVPLDPGKSTVVVKDIQGKLSAVPTRELPTPRP